MEEKIIQALKNGLFHSDSDIIDFAEDHNISVRTVYDTIARHEAKGTKCEGCKHVNYKPLIHKPCNNCIRLRDYSDCYERAE